MPIPLIRFKALDDIIVPLAGAGTAKGLIVDIALFSITDHLAASAADGMTSGRTRHVRVGKSTWTF